MIWRKNWKFMWVEKFNIMKKVKSLKKNLGSRHGVTWFLVISPHSALASRSMYHTSAYLRAFIITCIRRSTVSYWLPGGGGRRRLVKNIFDCFFLLLWRLITCIQNLDPTDIKCPTAWYCSSTGTAEDAKRRRSSKYVLRLSEREGKEKIESKVSY